MRILNIILAFILVFLSVHEVKSKEPSVKELKSPPPRIIRVCCAFGFDLKLMGLPFVKIAHVTSVDQLGNHHYLGNEDEEGNGLIYTRNGGFIDIGHLRDQADWTKYLYTLILENRDQDQIVQKLGYEGGVKMLQINTSEDLDSSDYLLLAGKIAYDLSLWHELSTWYGASTVPMMPERYSSFSVEDVYSNLLGVLIGMEAIQSEQPFNEAMTEILECKLLEMGSVQNEDETYQALEAVKNIWWTNEKRLPNRKVILERDTEVAFRVRPWILADSVFEGSRPEVLFVPKITSEEQLLTNYYSLNIDLNYKFPVDEIFPGRETRVITQDDFDVLLYHVAGQIKKKNSHLTNQQPVISQKHNKSQ